MPETMIINPFSVSAITLDFLSMVLCAVTLILALKLVKHRQFYGKETGEIKTVIENQTYLVFWLGVVLMGIRLLAWPLFYATLNSFVTEIQGAMCIFGVTKVVPDLTNLLELLKPLVFFLAGIWLVLFHLEKSPTLAASADSRTGGTGIVLSFLILTTGVILLDVAGSLLLWMKISPASAVSCCTTITDIPERFTAWVPHGLFGPEYQEPLLTLYFGGNLFVIGLSIWIFWCIRNERQLNLLLLTVHVLTALINIIVSSLAFIEILGPRLMGLSFHHCLYCFMQLVPDAPVFLGLFVLGSCSAIGTPMLYTFGYQWADPQVLQNTMKKMLLVSAVCLLASLQMVIIHLVM